MQPKILPLSHYLGVWAALLGLLALTIVAYCLPLGAFGAIANLGIATVKALLVILVFMHVRDSDRLIWVVAGGAFYWLGILIVLTLSDFLTVGWMPLPGK